MVAVGPVCFPMVSTWHGEIENSYAVAVIKLHVRTATWLDKDRVDLVFVDVLGNLPFSSNQAGGFL